jgi:hypothetical protein
VERDKVVPQIEPSITPDREVLLTGLNRLLKKRVEIVVCELPYISRDQEESLRGIGARIPPNIPKIF